MFKNRRIIQFFIIIILVSLACELPINLLDRPTEGNNTEDNLAVPPDPISDPEVIPPTLEIPVPQATQLPEVAVEDPTAIPTAIVEECENDSEFISDITIPDGSLLEIGVEIPKTWRIRNDGDCTWTTAYKWTQIGGNVLLANQSSKNLSHPVAPGEFLEITVILKLSSAATDGELYRAQFQLHDPLGVAFGTHPFALVFASPGTAVCPIDFVDYFTYISVTDGFCMFYPNTYSMNNTFDDPSREGVHFNSPHPGGDVQVMLATLSINLEGPAGGLTSQQYADQTVNDKKAPASTPVVTQFDLDGTPAFYTDELPGMFGNRILITVHNGIAYIMTIIPIDEVFPDETVDAEAFFDLMVSSFTWITP